LSVIGIAILVAAGAYFAYRFYKSKKEQGLSILPKKPKKPAHAVALDAYKELKEKDLIGQGLIKQYYTECSEILRKYLEDRYFIIALEETTAEILRDMQSQELAEGQFESLREILELSDLVKFAKYIPSSKENNTIIEDCIEFVKETKLEFIKENINSNQQLEEANVNIQSDHK
jgi:hypothetical protein